MKKICFVTTVASTLQAFIVGTAKYLYDTGEFDISFICDYNEEFEKSLPEYIHYYPVCMKRGISVGGLKAVFEIKNIIKKQKFDLVQYSTPNAACYTSIAAKLAKVPVRLYCQWGIAYVGFSGIKRKIFKLEEKMVCKLSSHIEPDSRGNLKFSQSEGLYSGNKGSVVWNGSACGVNTKKFNIENKTEWKKEIREKYNIPENAKVFTFIGRITKDKGINELLEATLKILEKYSDVYLFLVGDNENAESINSELYNKSLENNNIIYCGFTSEVEKYMSASDVYVLPSYREGFGAAVVEAEAMGVPVIVSDIPGPTDAMQKDITGLIVAKKSVEELYNAMELLYSDDSMRKNMGEASYNFAISNFEQQKLFKKIYMDRKQLLEM